MPSNSGSKTAAIVYCHRLYPSEAKGEVRILLLKELFKIPQGKSMSIIMLLSLRALKRLVAKNIEF